MNPYAVGAPAYIAAGWSGIVPSQQPGQKGPPLTGYTGADGVWPSAHLIEEWRTRYAGHNLYLRLPLDVIGIDLDAYKDPDVRAKLEAITGPLPPTWCSTSRPGTPSGIRLYRVPILGADETWRSAPIPACEIIQHHHRYVCAPPSIHPEGRPYLWIDENGDEERLVDPPEIDDLTHLPWAAIAALRIRRVAAEARPFEDVSLTAGDMSAVVERDLRAAVREVTGMKGGRHDAMMRWVATLVRLAERGEPGVDGAIEQLGGAFAGAVADDRPGGYAAAVAEFSKAVAYAQAGIGATAGRIPTRAEREAEMAGRWDVQFGPGHTAGPPPPPPPPGDAGATTPEPDPHDFGTVELAELVRRTDAPYEWLIPGLIERGDRIILTGIEGQGKSTMLRQFAVRCASGMHPLDDVDIDSIRVLYVDLENSERQTRRKMGGLFEAVSAFYDEGAMHFAFRPEGIDLTRQLDVAWLAGLCDHHRPDLVIIGPIYKMSTGDPKDEQDAKMVSTALDQLRTAYGFALLIEAHVPYADGGKSKRPIRPYGASLWSRWPEFGIFLDPSGDMPHWRGQRDEREWPKKVRRGTKWPWEVEMAWNVEKADKNAVTIDPDSHSHVRAAVLAFLASTPGVEHSGVQLYDGLDRTMPTGSTRPRKSTVTEVAERLAHEGECTVRGGARGARLFKAKVVESSSAASLFDDLIPPDPDLIPPDPGSGEEGCHDLIPPDPQHTPKGVWGLGPGRDASRAEKTTTTPRPDPVDPDQVAPSIDELLG